MEVDFLVARAGLRRRHNIIPIEVKSSGQYTTKALLKFTDKFSAYSTTACVLHEKDLVLTDDRMFLPVYMAGLLGVTNL